ncbi:MAG: hypothetical protein COW08_03730 [Ignavibacteriales bacterium CG12_big_fil_rev_8_21_14_0_65_30_8]|nr:MAG: hypothetical protein COW08_03730 [Ignavibacteriales bacterium CG12_big_fil_rev_8_21_14_0_65_30_8]
MKKLISISIFSLFLLTGFLCSEDIQVQKGTVIYLNLEGGFYGIIGDNGKHYDPQNLPDNFKRDSLRVSFEYKVSENQVSVHMWGELIEIVKIVEL